MGDLEHDNRNDEALSFVSGNSVQVVARQMASDMGKITDLKQQRDDLLAALKWAIKQMPEPSLSGPYFDGYKIAKEAIDKADLTQ